MGAASRNPCALPDLSLAAMQPGPQTSSSSSHHTRPELSSAPRRGMDRALQPQTPQPPKTCSSSGMTGKACWSWDLKVALILVTLAGALILLLLFRLLQLRHRLNLVRAGHPLEYSGFYHSATYTLRQPTPCQDLPAKNGIFSEKASTIQTVTVVTPAVSTPVPPPPVTPQPSLPLPSHPVLPPPPLHTALSLPPTPRVLSFPPPCDQHHPTEPPPVLGCMLGCRCLFSDWRFQAFQAVKSLQPINSDPV